MRRLSAVASGRGQFRRRRWQQPGRQHLGRPGHGGLPSSAGLVVQGTRRGGRPSRHDPIHDRSSTCSRRPVDFDAQALNLPGATRTGRRLPLPAGPRRLPAGSRRPDAILPAACNPFAADRIARSQHIGGRFRPAPWTSPRGAHPRAPWPALGAGRLPRRGAICREVRRTEPGRQGRGQLSSANRGSAE